MNKWCKSAVCLALCTGLFLSLSACTSFMELYERLLIHGIGIDCGKNGYVVTVRSSTSSEEEGEEFFKSEGETVLEALNNLSLLTGREPFYSHNYLVVFGRECAKEGLDSSLDFFVRYYNTRPAVKMFLAENTAEEVLGAEKDGKLLRMSELQQLANSSRYNGKTVGMDILEFVNGVRREGSSPYLPVLKAGEDGVKVVATAIFDGYRLQDYLTLEETRGLLMIRNQVEKGESVISDEAFGTVTLSISTREGKTQVTLGEDGRPRFLVKIQAEADISAISGGRTRFESGAYGKLEAFVGEELQRQAEDAIRTAVLKNSCDIFGFGNLLYQKYPSFWKGLDWEKQMAECSYVVQVETKVQRIEEETFDVLGGKRNA